MRIRPGLSPAPASRVAVVDGAALGGEHRRGGAGGQCAQLGVDVGDLVGPGSGGGGPGGAVSAWSPMRGRWVAGAGRVRARALMSSPPLRRAKRVRTASGAVAGRAVICRWAATRAFIALRRQARSTRICSQGPVPVLATGRASAPGRCSAGGGSGSDRIGARPRRRRERLGRMTSRIGAPAAPRGAGQARPPGAGALDADHPDAPAGADEVAGPVVARRGRRDPHVAQPCAGRRAQDRDVVGVLVGVDPRDDPRPVAGVGPGCASRRCLSS